MDTRSLNAGSLRRKQLGCELAIEDQKRAQELHLIKYSVEALKIHVERVLTELDLELMKLTRKLEGMLKEYDTDDYERIERSQVCSHAVHCTTSLETPSKID